MGLESMSLNNEGRYVSHKPKYMGTVCFENKIGESFVFKLDELKCNKYIEIISQEIVSSAESLSKELLISLGLSNEVIEAQK